MTVNIAGVVCTVVAIMYWLGWEMGAVEAISLSILVGSSVDYCLHLVEGYLLAGDVVAAAATSDSPLCGVKNPCLFISCFLVLRLPLKLPILAVSA